MKFLLVALLLFFSYNSFSQSIHYTVTTPEPQTHYAEVKIQVKNWKEKTMEITMPSWTPGSYLMREFAKSVDDVIAQGNGKDLPLKKIDKNTWKIQTKGIKDLTISYPVYCFELSVRTSFIDDSHAYFNGTSLLMYIEGYKNNPGKVTYQKHSSFSKITTALPSSEEKETFVFKNYDHLVDCPVEIGNHETFEFEASGVNHTVAMYGEGNYDVARLKIDMAKICSAATDVFGKNPNKEYVFIIHNLTEGSGGLEHKNSTTLQVNRWTYEESKYIGFLSLVAHEYFHLWNVKRIRPEVLGPFDYDQENYTNMLWVMEGFTSYYDELLLYRAGYYSQEEYINKLMGTVNYVESLPGNKVQPVAHSSFDAWIKAYRRNENTVNTEISYYSKGSIIAAILDFKIIEKSDGALHLDDFLKELYANFEKTGKGFKETEFKNLLEKYAGPMDEFYASYIFGTEAIPYESFFEKVGLQLEKMINPSPYLGFYTSNSGGQWIVNSVRRNGSAYLGGINVNDEILAVDGWRYSDEMLEHVLDLKEVGDIISFTIARDQKIKTLEFTLEPGRYPKFNISKIIDNKSFKKWLSFK